MDQQKLDIPAKAQAPDTGTNHTRVPNILQDLVYPLLSRPEHLCLSYIVRRTEGFTDGAGGRKEVDRISLSQFHAGIQSGPYILDLGTGLSRPSIRKALDDLQRKGLITVGYKCALCGWEPAEDVGPLSESRGLLCGQCGKTCDRNFGLARMTSKVMLRFLTENDPQARRWGFDREKKRFFVYTDEEGDEERRLPGSKRQQQEEAAARASEDFMRELWFPQLVEQVAEQIEGSMSAGRKLSAAQRLTHVIKPVLAMQKIDDPSILKYALEQTLARQIPASAKVRQRSDGTSARESNWKWHHYTMRIVETELAKLGAKGSGRTNAQVTQSRTPEAAQETVRVLLERAADLNTGGDFAAARKVLADILAQAKQLAPLFGNSAEAADAHLRLAFKYGVTNFRSVRREVPLNDFYPDWEWPAEIA